MNLQNFRQVSGHLSRVIKTQRQLNEAILILEKTRRHAIGRFSGIVEFNNEGIISVPYFENHAPESEKVYLFGDKELGETTLIEEKIVWVMGQYDAPFSKYEVSCFAKFFELDENILMEGAATNEQYEAWAAEEMRAGW